MDDVLSATLRDPSARAASTTAAWLDSSTSSVPKYTISKATAPPRASTADSLSGAGISADAAMRDGHVHAWRRTLDGLDQRERVPNGPGNVDGLLSDLQQQAVLHACAPQSRPSRHSRTARRLGHQNHLLLVIRVHRAVPM